MRLKSIHTERKRTRNFSLMFDIRDVLFLIIVKRKYIYLLTSKSSECLVHWGFQHGAFTRLGFLYLGIMNFYIYNLGISSHRTWGSLHVEPGNFYTQYTRGVGIRPVHTACL